MANEEIKFWSAEELLAFSEATKNVLIQGMYFQIKKLKADIMDKTDYKTTDIIERGLVNPKLDTNTIKKLPIDIVKELAEQITEYSGIKPEQAEKN
jgi:hypothetical protein